jgi:hypothetical protein
MDTFLKETLVIGMRKLALASANTKAGDIIVEINSNVLILFYLITRLNRFH